MAKEVVRSHGFKVGDVLCSQWGYEQTNVTMYQVIALNGKSMVTVREVRLPVKNVEPTGWASENVSYVVPSGIVDSKAKPLRRQVRNYYKDRRPEGDHISISEYADAYKYAGEMLDRSWYA